MTARVQGGARGILAAIASGRLDELDARLPEDRDLPPMSGSDRRAVIRRDRLRMRKLAHRSPV